MQARWWWWLAALVVVTTAEDAPRDVTSTALEIVRQLEADPRLREAVQHQLFDQPQHQRLAVADAARRQLGGEFHSIFELTCHPGQPLGSGCAYWDWMFFGFWLVLLIVVTIVVEAMLHKLEIYTRHSSRLGRHILQKMIRELALLGFVSWFAILFANLQITAPWLKAGSAFRFLMLEFAHVMIFVMAIMFCFMIALVYRTIRNIEQTWERIEDPGQRMHEEGFDPWQPSMDALTCLRALLESNGGSQRPTGKYDDVAEASSAVTLVSSADTPASAATTAFAAASPSPPPSPPTPASPSLPPNRRSLQSSVRRLQSSRDLVLAVERAEGVRSTWTSCLRQWCRPRSNPELRRAWRAAHHFVLMYEFKRAHRCVHLGPPNRGRISSWARRSP